MRRYTAGAERRHPGPACGRGNGPQSAPVCEEGGRRQAAAKRGTITEPPFSVDSRRRSRPTARRRVKAVNVRCLFAVDIAAGLARPSHQHECPLLCKRDQPIARR